MQITGNVMCNVIVFFVAKHNIDINFSFFFLSVLFAAQYIQLFLCLTMN